MNECALSATITTANSLTLTWQTNFRGQWGIRVCAPTVYGILIYINARAYLVLNFGKQKLQRFIYVKIIYYKIQPTVNSLNFLLYPTQRMLDMFMRLLARSNCQVLLKNCKQHLSTVWSKICFSEWLIFILKAASNHFLKNGYIFIEYFTKK